MAVALALSSAAFRVCRPVPKVTRRSSSMPRQPTMRTEGRVVPNVVKKPYGTVVSTLRAAATTSAASTSTTTNLFSGRSRALSASRRGGAGGRARGLMFAPVLKPLRGQPQRGVHPGPQVLHGDDRSELHQLRLAVPPGRHGADLRGRHMVLHRGFPVAEVHAPRAADPGGRCHDGQVLQPAVEPAPPLHLQLKHREGAAHRHVVRNGGAWIEHYAVPAAGNPRSDPVAERLRWVK